MMIDAVVNQRWYPGLPKETYLAIAESGGPQPYSDSEHTKAFVRTAIPFALHNLASHFYENDRDRCWGVSDFPKPVPPFENCWFEWNAPQFLVQFCEFKRIGCLVSARAYSQGLQGNTAIPFIERINGDIGTWPAVVWTTDNVGSMVEMEGDASSGCELTSKILCAFVGDYYRDLTDKDKDKIGEVARQIVRPMMFALSILNCKNAVQRDARQAQALVKARTRRGLWSRSSFKIIEIRPIGRKSKPTEAADSPIRKRKVDIRRGHFKNYQEGSGLFGKLHGLYWWDQFVEGDPGVAYKFSKSVFPGLELIDGTILT